MSERRKRTNYMKQGGVKAIALFPLLLLCFIKYGFIAYKAGMSTLSYFALVFMAFLLLYALNGMFIPDVLKRMIYFQINKGSYKNASHIYHIVLILSEGIAVIEAVALFFASDFLSKFLFHTILCSLLFKVMAVALILLVARQCMKGYLEGMGNPMPGTVASFVGIILSLITTFLLQNLCGSYGSKVAAVLNQESYYYAYAALAGTVGFLVYSLFSLLFLLFIMFLFQSTIKKQIKQDDVKSVDSVHDILSNYLMTYLPEMLNRLFMIVLIAALVYLYRKQAQITENGMGMVFAILLFGMIVICFAYLIATPFSRQLTVIFRKQDMPHARERMAVNLKVLTYTIFPLLTFTLCMAGRIGQGIFDCSDGTFIHLMRLSIWVLLIMAFALFLNIVLSAVISRWICNGVQLFAWGCGILSFQLFKNTMLPEDAFLYAILMANLVVFLVDSVLLFKLMRFKNDLLRIFAFPLVGSILLGIISFIMNKFLGNLLGSWFILILTAVIGYLIYHVCIVFTHTFDHYEWNDVPFHVIPVSIAKKMNMY